MSTLITGSTGFVGREVLFKILEDEPETQVSLIVRPAKNCSAKQRVLKMLKRRFTPIEFARHWERIKVFEGSLSEKKFGLVEADYHYLLDSTEAIFHSAATIKFNLPKKEAAQINIKGTQEVLDLAWSCYSTGRFKALYHISTAYVTGRQRNITPAQGKSFANTYEETKHEAEQVVASYINQGLPAIVFRPSIISGNSKTGEITSNNIIFKFFYMFSKETFNQFPCCESSSLNIIPIDYFITTMFSIIHSGLAMGKRFNISNDTNLNFTNMVRKVCHRLNTKAPEFIAPKDIHKLKLKELENIQSFLPYFEESHTFDLSSTKEVLQENYKPCPDVTSGLYENLDYCLRHRLLRAKN